LNIKTGEVWRLNATTEQLTQIMVVLLQKLVRFDDNINDTNDTNDDDGDKRFIENHIERTNH